MSYVLEYLAEALRAARQRKGLSQRELSQATGIPQAQISRIENAGVDARASTLINLSRALDLELMPVPRRYVPAVKSIIEFGEGGSERTEQRPAYALDGEDDDA